MCSSLHKRYPYIPLPLAATILVIGILLSVNHYADITQGIKGLTTVVSSILVVLTGALATVSNTLVKGSVAVSGGSPALRKAILPATLIMTAAGAILVFTM
jgi:hypothetical protein